MTLKLTIWGLKHFPLFAENSLFRMKTFPGNHGLLGYSCAVNQPIILASLVLSVKFDDLTGKKRADVVVALSTVFGIAIRDVFVLPNAVQSPFLSLLESSHVVASGPGSRTLMTGPSTLLTWRVKCGVVHVKDPLFEELQQGSRKWSATKNISFEVIGWHVVTGFQRRYNMQVLLRRRRNALGGSTTPVYSTIPISRATVVTTRLRPSKTSYTTSTVFLTRVQPSPTFSSFFGNSSSFEIRLSSSRKLSEQTNSSLSQQSTVNLSSGILNSRNVSMIPQLSSFKLSSFIQASSTSTVIQRNTTVTVEPLNRVSISSDHRGSGELLSSTAFKNTTATMSSYLRSRDTNYIRTSLLSFTSTSSMVSNSLYSSATLLPSLISSRSTSKIHNVTTASISVSSRSVKLPSPTRKYWLTSETKATTFSNPEQSRTSLVMSLDVISRTTNLASGTTGGISLRATTAHSVYESSIVSPTHPGITSTQSHVRTSSYPLLTAYRSSTFPIISTFRIVESSLHKTTLVNQTKTVVSSLSQFATPGLNVTPTTSLLTVSFVVSKTGPATSQLASYTSNFIFKSSVAYSTALKSSTVTDIQSLPIGFSSQTNVRDKTSFDIMLRTTLSRTSRKTSQFLTRITLSSVWFMGTTEATRFTPLQTSFSGVTQIKEYSSVMLTRMITGVTSSANLSATTVMGPGSKSVLDVVTPGR